MKMQNKLVFVDIVDMSNNKAFADGYRKQILSQKFIQRGFGKEKVL